MSQNFLKKKALLLITKIEILTPIKRKRIEDHSAAVAFQKGSLKSFA